MIDPYVDKRLEEASEHQKTLLKLVLLKDKWAAYKRLLDKQQPNVTVSESSLLSIEGSIFDILKNADSNNSTTYIRILLDD